MKQQRSGVVVEQRREGGREGDHGLQEMHTDHVLLVWRPGDVLTADRMIQHANRKTERVNEVREREREREEEGQSRAKEEGRERVLGEGREEAEWKGAALILLSHF